MPESGVTPEERLAQQALVQLHLWLASRSVHDLRERLAELGLSEALPPEVDPNTLLGVVVATSLLPTPLERLDLLRRLILDPRNVVTRERLAALASGLLDNDSSLTPEQLIDVLPGITFDSGRDGFITIHGLDEQLKLRPARRELPGADRTPRRVGDLLGGGSLARKVASAPLVDVDAWLYKAEVRGTAEYCVHLRTKITFAAPTKPFDDFRKVLDPKDWPTYHPFWTAMDKGDTKAALTADGVPQQAADEVLQQQGTYDARIPNAWDSLRTFHETVGSHPKDDVFPLTCLYFTRTSDTARPALLSYSLMPTGGMPTGGRLGVDDGCIEIAESNGNITVTTTKSLHITGVGNSVELAGVLAYFAAHSGWGANTVTLVSNAVDP